MALDYDYGIQTSCAFTYFFITFHFYVHIMLVIWSVLSLQCLNLNFGTPKLACSKLGYQCQQQLVSTPDFWTSLRNAKFYLRLRIEPYQYKTESIFLQMRLLHHVLLKRGAECLNKCFILKIVLWLSTVNLG